jgi:hypothetical protein
MPVGKRSIVDISDIHKISVTLYLYISHRQITDKYS